MAYYWEQNILSNYAKMMGVNRDPMPFTLTPCFQSTGNDAGSHHPGIIVIIIFVMLRRGVSDC